MTYCYRGNVEGPALPSCWEPHIERLVASMTSKRLVGGRHYGRLDPMRKTLDAWLQDIAEELVDGLVYCLLAIERLARGKRGRK